MRLALCCLLFALPACASDAPAADSVDLVGAEWHLVALQGKPPLEAHPITMAVDDEGTIAGIASVNRYSARTAVHPDGRWTVEGPLLTRMAGPSEAMDQEQLFVRMLTRGDGWRRRGERLEVRERDRVLLLFER